MKESYGETKPFFDVILEQFSEFFGNILEQVEELAIPLEDKVKLAAELMQAAVPIDNISETALTFPEPLEGEAEVEEISWLKKPRSGMGVDIGPTVLVAHASTIAMQAVFHIQTAILAMNKAVVSGGGSVPADVLAFKLNIYSAARSNLLEALELLAAVNRPSDKRFPSIIPPVPQPLEGLSADELIARADMRAEQAMSETLQANSRLDLAKMKFREYGKGDAAAQVQSAKDLFDIACDQLKVGIMGSIPDDDEELQALKNDA